jgi:preprotein translocase subunit SecD
VERFARYGLVGSAPDDSAPPADDATTGDDATTDTTAGDGTTDDGAGSEAPGEPSPDAEIPVEPPIDFGSIESPIPGFDLLPTLDGGALCVGPAQGSGEVFERQGASVQNDPGAGGVFVVATLRDEGEVIWNNLAAQCYNGAPTCPPQGGSSRGQLAIVLDSVIQSAPTVNAPSFDEEVQITGAFSVSEAEDLANVLNRGAFPVQLEPQDTRTVSPSTGSGSLRAAVIAGLLGFSLVLTLLIAYYRLFGLVIIAGMITWAAAVYSVAALVSDWTNYTLSLAGVTGIIVAVGVTVDSYIVFFERMKDEIRNGRTPRNAAPRSFNATWRTIWTADLVSVIGASILFMLSVGSVRGFALYLGITTLCDLAICYFFTRPSVVLLARSRFMQGRSAFGLEVAR